MICRDRERDGAIASATGAARNLHECIARGRAPTARRALRLLDVDGHAAACRRDSQARRRHRKRTALWRMLGHGHGLTSDRQRAAAFRAGVGRDDVSHCPRARTGLSDGDGQKLSVTLGRPRATGGRRDGRRELAAGGFRGTRSVGVRERERARHLLTRLGWRGRRTAGLRTEGQRDRERAEGEPETHGRES